MHRYRGFWGHPPAMFSVGERKSRSKRHGGGMPTKPTKVLKGLDTLCIGIAIKSKIPPERPPPPYVN